MNERIVKRANFLFYWGIAFCLLDSLWFHTFINWTSLEKIHF